MTNSLPQLPTSGRLLRAARVAEAREGASGSGCGNRHRPSGRLQFRELVEGDRVHDVVGAARRGDHDVEGDRAVFLDAGLVAYEVDVDRRRRHRRVHRHGEVVAVDVDVVAVVALLAGRAVRTGL